MADFVTVAGFEDVWRPPVRLRPRRPESVMSSASGGGLDPRARLSRIVNRAPEVMVKVTGRTRDGDHLRAHLDYISRNGALEMDGAQGELVAGRSAVRELAEDWAALAMADGRRRTNSPMSLSLVLSMPAGADAIAVRDAGRAFAREVFGDRFDHVLALHTDAQHPHVHIAVCARGQMGERLNPRKADLEHWRQVFAEALRQRGVEAEATPRRARGVTRKAERGPLRRLGERHAAGRGPLARVRRAALHEAAQTAVRPQAAPTPWEKRLLERQASVRGLYLAQARLLGQSADPADRDLAARVVAFVQSMPRPDSQRLSLARELRGAARRLDAERVEGGKDRSR